MTEIKKQVKRVLIITDIDNFVHFDFIKQDYTLCGLETKGDSGLGIKAGERTSKKVNCPDCIEVVTFCKRIKTTEYKKNQSIKIK